MVVKIIVLTFAALILKAQSQVCNTGSLTSPFQGLTSNINACVTPIPPSRNRVNNVVAETSTDCSCRPSFVSQAFLSNPSSCGSRNNLIGTVESADCSSKPSIFVQPPCQNPTTCGTQISTNILTGPASSLLETSSITSSGLNSCGGKTQSIPKPRLPSRVTSFNSIPESNCLTKPVSPSQSFCATISPPVSTVVVENGVANSLADSLQLLILNDVIENTLDCIPLLSTTANTINALTGKPGFSTASTDSIAIETQSSNPFASRCSNTGSNVNIFRNNIRSNSCPTLPKVGIPEIIMPSPVGSCKDIPIPIGFSNIVGPSTSSAISEAVSSANIQTTTGIRPFPFGVQNNLAPSSQAVSITEANAVSIDSSNPYASRGLGSFNSLNPSSSAVSVAEATSSVNIETSLPTNPYSYVGFNNLPTPFLPTLSFPGISRPGICRFPEVIRPTPSASTQTVSIAEANAISVDSSNNLISNGFSGFNPTSSAVSVAEATSSVNIDTSTSLPTNPYSCGGFNNFPTPMLPTLGFPGITRPGICGFPEVIRPTPSTSTQALSIAEANAIGVDSSNNLISNEFSGFNPTSSAVSVAEAASSVNIEPSLLANPYSFGFNTLPTPFLPTIGFPGISTPGFCGFPEIIRPTPLACETSYFASSQPFVPACFGTPQTLPIEPTCGTTEVTSTSTSAVAVAESSSSAVADVSSDTSVSIAESSATAVSVDPVIEEIAPIAATPIILEEEPCIEEVVAIPEVSPLPVVTSSPTILPCFEASPITLEVVIPTYELYIPSSIPAQMACTVGNIPSYGRYC